MSDYQKEFERLMEPLVPLDLIAVSDNHKPRMHMGGGSVVEIRRLVVRYKKFWLELKQKIAHRFQEFDSQIVEFVVLADKMTEGDGLPLGDIVEIQDCGWHLFSFDEIFTLIALELFNPWPEKEEER
ncbi:MAG: hypothetical protein WC663_04065 [Patescibacteria group bacterium]